MTDPDPEATRATGPPSEEDAAPNQPGAGGAAPPEREEEAGASESTPVDEVLAVLVRERDEYLDALQRVKAEFDNYRRRTAREHAELVERAGSQLAEVLLPVLDACDAAVSHGATDVEPVRAALLDVLGKQGLERMDPEGQPFDPNLYEAVVHEPGEGAESVVVEDLRAGYQWRGQVLRPAMVRVRG